MFPTRDRALCLAAHGSDLRGERTIRRKAGWSGPRPLGNQHNTDIGQAGPQRNPRDPRNTNFFVGRALAVPEFDVAWCNGVWRKRHMPRKGPRKAVGGFWALAGAQPHPDRNAPLPLRNATNRPWWHGVCTRARGRGRVNQGWDHGPTVAWAWTARGCPSRRPHARSGQPLVTHHAGPCASLANPHPIVSFHPHPHSIPQPCPNPCPAPSLVPKAPQQSPPGLLSPNRIGLGREFGGDWERNWTGCWWGLGLGGKGKLWDKRRLSGRLPGLGRVPIPLPCILPPILTPNSFWRPYPLLPSPLAIVQFPPPSPLRQVPRLHGFCFVEPQTFPVVRY